MCGCFAISRLEVLGTQHSTLQDSQFWSPDRSDHITTMAEQGSNTNNKMAENKAEDDKQGGGKANIEEKEEIGIYYTIILQVTLFW